MYPRENMFSYSCYYIRNNVNFVSQHNHLHEPDQIEAKKTINKIKSRATTTMEKPRHVVMQSCPQSVSASLTVALTNLDAVRQTINYNRKKTLIIAKTNPFSRKDIQLPEITTETGCFTLLYVNFVWRTSFIANFNHGEL